MPPNDHGASEPGDASDHLTISEAAARFGVPPRALRRAIERCQNVPETFPRTVQKTVRTKTGERSAVAFPLPFVERLAGEIRALAAGTEQTTTAPGNVPQGEQERAGNVTENVPRNVSGNVPNVSAESAELLDQLRGEVAYLRAALEQSAANVKASEENTRAALAQLAEARKEGQVLIAAAAAGRILPPVGSTGAIYSDAAAAGPDAAQTVPPEASGAATRGETSRIDESGEPTETRPNWWARLWKK